MNTAGTTPAHNSLWSIRQERETEEVNYQSMECHEEVQNVMGICNRQTSPMLRVREVSSQPPLAPGRYAQEALRVKMDGLDQGEYR